MRFKISSLTTCLVLFGITLQAQEVVDEYNYNQNIEFTNKGWEAIDSEEYSKGIRHFSEAIDLYDGNTDAYSGKATAYLKLKKYDSAKIYVNKALVISPNEADLNYLSGNISMRLQDFKNAISQYSVALKQNATSEIKIDLANCHFNRGNAYLFSGQYENAKIDFSKSLNQRPFANAYHNKGIALRHLNQQQEACNNFKQALSLGSKQSRKYLEQYCKGMKPQKIKPKSGSIQQNANQSSLIKSDTIEVTLYYNGNWELTNKHNRVTYRKAQIRVSDKSFVGPFVDYYPGGSVLSHWEKEPYRFGYQGEYSEEDKETGFNHFEARAYDSRINRWLNPDPARQYASPYKSMGNNWIRLVDPDGRKHEYTMGDNGDISMTKFTLDNHDDLFAANGDMIAGGIRKGILADGMNFLTDFNMIDLTFDELSMDITSSGSAQSFVLQLSKHLEKEMAGFQFMDGKGTVKMMITPSSINDYRTSRSISWLEGRSGKVWTRYSSGSVIFKGNEYKMISWFHTHPGKGNWGGTVNPSQGDKDWTNNFNVPGHIYGGKGGFNTIFPSK